MNKKLVKLFAAALLFSGFFVRTSSGEAPEKIDWKLDDAYRFASQSGLREKICLNGIWRITLRENIGLNKDNIPKLDFLSASKPVEIRVPGEWYDDAWFSPTQYETLLPIKGNRGPTPHINAALEWEGKPVKNYSYALYEREFKAPENWKPGDAFLHFDQVNTEAWFFINGKYIAYQSGLQAEDIPLPAGIKPGATVNLKVLVGAFASGTKEKFMGAEMVTKVQNESLSRGILGDTWLVKRPAEIFIKDVYIVPSVREKLLKLRIEYSAGSGTAPSGPAGPLNGRLEGKITPTGKSDTAKEFKIDLKEGRKLDNGSYEYKIPWENPTYWSPENPYLYDLHLNWMSADNKLLDSCLPQRFGFRELWFSGVDYYLNGYPYRFRMRASQAFTDENAAGYFIKNYRELGFNAIEISHGGYEGYGMNLSGIPFLKKADEMGMLVIFITPAANELRYEWNKPGVKEKYSKALAYCIKSVRNHPSIVHWSMNYNLLGYPLDMSPWHIATDYLPPDGLIGLGIKRVIQKDSEAMLRSLDDSRPIFQHAGGNHGEISTSNMYLNFIQQQEKENWPMYWRTKGNKPFIAIELGMPYEATYFRSRMANDAGKSHYHSEPMYAEYAAMFFGSEPYNMEPAERMKPIIESTITAGFLNGDDKYFEVGAYFFDGGLHYYPFNNYLKSQAFTGGFLRSWRAWGVCGYDPYEATDARLHNDYHNTDGTVAAYDSFKTPGLKTRFIYKPTYKDKTILWDAYKKWMEPELFYVGGPKADFTDKKHAFESGEKITKSVVFVNDTLQNRNETLVFEAKDDKSDVSIFRQELKLSATPGEIQFNEVTFDSPLVAQSAQKTSYSIYLTKTENDKLVLKDTFALQVFPKQAAGTTGLKTARKIRLIDSKGLTGKLLAGLGISFKNYSNEKLGAGDLLVVGRESLSALSEKAPKIKDSIRSGLNVVIFEQTQADLEKYCKLRSYEAASRIVFLAEEAHPIYEGLANEDLANWTGRATLTEEFQKPAKDENPQHIWRFGNQGIVSTVVIEKPHQGAFVPLMHTEFDMGYTPLMEERIGKGVLMYCQLDVTARTQSSPVANLLTKNIIKYLGDKPAGKTTKVFALGDAHGMANLDLACIEYEKTADLKILPAGAIVTLCGRAPLAGQVSQNKESLLNYMKNGGTLVLLAVTDLKEITDALGAPAAVSPMQGYWFNYKKTGNITYGISSGDLFWKDNFTVPLPDKNFPLYESTIGGGRLVICQVDPLYYPAKEMHQRRERSRQKLSRMVAIVFANLGAPSKITSLDYLEGSGLTDIDLMGEWNFRIDIDDKGLEKGWNKQVWTDGYKKMIVPGSWESQGENTPNPNVDGKEPYDGYAWYQKSFVIPSSAKGIQLYSEMGCVDDYDWTYFNGQEIGKIGKETPGYWAARRFYAIPPELIKYDGLNTITVRDYDGYQDGGIMKDPVRVTFKKEQIFLYLDSNIPSDRRWDPYHFKRW